METITRTALVVYESMFGGTEQIARAIANGLESSMHVRVGSVDQVPAHDAGGVDLLVVGGPTHTHGMSSPVTRAEAIRWADDPSKGLELAPGTHSRGVREWLTGLEGVPVFAAFDTRASIPRLLSGAASRAISRELSQRGGVELCDAESFLVDRSSSLLDTEVKRALAWGDALATALLDRAASR